ncbi:Rsc6p CYBJADRAFT_168781 [Cyberlindnera jadinii NRRL Y-1542]|uniref:DM2 domain-containing protein n=1 Tax=Cyberlindnera jadinii (strain ATCC 18201 / CBS 1600 / BCRC 20928 / JCM 3617 / NBRC 0987 / NRRL Y-1542) TaxID=983966 RepID=A0A1E4RXT5_CYBJN|nr:hypothetical protein CYBJADRAFT_168781 [Cyberlindnera jadinii NRRL Y-1542]ODV72084.1 hypothetical protein CYBJADRAFT_168781 [Cyberlindnera jadinii NRRL Y-1542]
MNRANPNGPQQVVQQGVSAAQIRPTDITIRRSLDSFIPELELYRKLVDAEKRIDILTARKFSDVTEVFNKFPRKKELLRIFVYNIAENQPWQQKEGEALSGEPSWTLRIEGRLVNEKDVNDATRRKFSTLVTGIAIDLLPQEEKKPLAGDSQPGVSQQDPQQPLQPQQPQQPLQPQQPQQTQQPQPSQQPQQPPSKDNIIEWHEQQDPKAKQAEFDGLDIKRNGAKNLKAKITIQPKEYPIYLQTSSELRSLIGVAETTQHDAVYAIWQYIQLNNLQAVDDKRVINCDESLSQLFGVPRFNFKDIIALLSKHLTPNKPISIEYEIRVDRASTLGDVVIDVEVPVEDIAEQELLREESKKLVTEHDEAIKELSTKIVLGVQGLHNSHRKYQFYDKLSQDPATFLKSFTESHSKLLKILSGDEGYNEEDVRRSTFYTDDLLAENIDVLLKTNRL